jgi:RNA polymerase sigma factor (sigma-70 family)
MTTGLNRAVEHLRQVLAQPDGDTTDEQLLQRFLTERDEASFALLVRRHGPMVLGVCRRVLGHLQDAEDAFQATFLVLARKAAVVQHKAVASFLYAVAYRTALESRAIQLRRRVRERQVQNMPQPPVLPNEAQDWRPLLDRELQRLPEKYRRVLLLCYLEGRPRKEVARQLGLPEGTLSSRLDTARHMLAKRLGRYGLSLAAGALAAALAEGASAALPMPLLASTAKAAVRVAAGQMAALTTPAEVLMHGVLKAMLMKKLTVALVVVLAGLLLGAGGLAYRAAGQATPSGAELEQRLQQLAQLRKQRAELDRQEKELLAAIRAEVQEQTRAAEVVSECEGKLIFVGTEIKPGEVVADGKLVEPDPWFSFLAVEAQPGDVGAFQIPHDPSKIFYRRWREGDQPEPGKCVVFRQAGRIRKLQVGDKVQRGDLVAVVNPAVALNDLAIALAEFDAADAEFRAAGKSKELAQVRYEAYSRATPGSISKDEMLKAQLEALKGVEDEKVKQAAVRAAQAKLNKAATTMQMHEIRSAVSGVVTAIDKKPGEMVRNGDAILHLREP